MGGPQCAQLCVPPQANRDRFVLSNGHSCALLYSMLHLTGYDLTLDDLKGLKKSRVQRILKDRVEGGLKRSKAPPRSPEISLPGSPEMRRGKLSLAGTSRENVTDF